MRIIIIGAGEVGQYLAKSLSQEAKDVIVIESTQSIVHDQYLCNIRCAVVLCNCMLYMYVYNNECVCNLSSFCRVTTEKRPS